MGTIGHDELAGLCRAALERSGADARDAAVLAEATVEAEQVGNRAVGVAHLFDYLAAYAEGRIEPVSRPRVHRPARAVVDVDAAGGLAQTAFVDALGALREAARGSGLAALWIRGSFTCGELGHYPRRLAQEGFVALACANSPALVSLGGSPDAVLGTNPLAYAVPRPGRLPLVVDQATSSTAFVNVRRAAATGEPIPAGWALGPDGAPTEDAAAALQGVLLPFGGHRGGNVALLVELLATLAGGEFSLDAHPFDRGDASPGIGVFVLVIDPSGFPGSVERLGALLARLRDDHAVHLPAVGLTALPDVVEVDDDQLRRLRLAGAAAPSGVSST